MRYWVFLTLVVSLVACAGNLIQESAPTKAPIVVTSTRLVSPTENSVLEVAQLPNQPNENPSDIPVIYKEDCSTIERWCLLDGHFWLSSPILNGNLMTSDGYRYGSNLNNTRETHHGVEFENPSGTPVVSAGSGIVVFAGEDKNDRLAWVPAFYGQVIILQHNLEQLDFPVFTLYGHLSSIGVKVGDKIGAGDEIGKVGLSGTAIGAHLHFEVRQAINDYEHNQNPLLWVIPPRDTGVIAGRVLDKDGNPITAVINVQKFVDGILDSSSLTTVSTYYQKILPVGKDLFFGENFAAGNFQPGKYRLSLIYNGHIIEEIVDVKSNQLTFINFIVE